MEGYALYQHCVMAKRGLSLKRLQDTGRCPVIDDYLRLRQVIPEDRDVSLKDVVKREVEYSLDKLRGTVMAEMTDGITTCWFLEDAETVTRLPFFFRERRGPGPPRTPASFTAGSSILWHSPGKTKRCGVSWMPTGMLPAMTPPADLPGKSWKS